MSFKILIAVFVFSLLIFTIAGGQTIDSSRETRKTFQTEITTITTSGNTEIDNDFSPGLFFFAFLGIGLVFICTGIGVALVAAGLLLVFGLISLGILSTSIIVGLQKKSFNKGFKTFLLLSTSTGGLCICTAATYIINQLFNLHLTVNNTLIIGVVSGLLGGVLLGQVLYTMIRRLGIYFRSRLYPA